MTRVALDGRGAERGPQEIAAAARELASDGIELRVFGDPVALAELRGLERVSVVEAKEEITNHDEPVAAVRSHPEASIVLAARDVAAGRSDALASAGPTGATMAASLFALRRLQGVRRPALAVQIPVPGCDRPALLLDAGANTQARAGDLVQFAYLGAAFAAAVLGIARPRVGLLSVGEEPSKGTAEVVAAHGALAGAGGIDFRGNAEGRDLLAGELDVIVTDGFTGNVVLKTIEGTASSVATAVREAARSNPMAAAGGLLLRPALTGLRRRMDPNATGGAILLGLRGVAVVGHGSSTAAGIANAVRLAARAVETGALARTAALLEREGAGRGALRDRGPSGPAAALSEGEGGNEPGGRPARQPGDEPQP